MTRVAKVIMVLGCDRFAAHQWILMSIEFWREDSGGGGVVLLIY